MTASAHDPAAELLVELDALGVRLEANGNRVRFRPRRAVTAELAARIKTRKAELIAAVRRRDALDRRLADQLAELVPYETADGRRGWINPQYRAEVEALRRGETIDT